MQQGKLLKSIPVESVDVQQTLLVLPVAYLKYFSIEHCATFQELTPDSLSVTMVAKGERPMNRPYKLVTRRGSSWVSIPRGWLRNIAAMPGDFLDVYESDHAYHLIVKFRKAIVVAKEDTQ